jgi:hypothetical protein
MYDRQVGQEILTNYKGDLVLKAVSEGAGAASGSAAGSPSGTSAPAPGGGARWGAQHRWALDVPQRAGDRLGWDA